MERLVADLIVLGFNAEVATSSKSNQFVIIRNFEIPLGRFVGRSIDLGIPSPVNFPISFGASMHVKAFPQLFDYGDTVAGIRNIIDSELGAEWRYWSLNFDSTGEHTTRRLMSMINGVFKRA